jgi:lipid-A-disaccharide synthase
VNILLMPGSRYHEIETILPSMLDAKRLIERSHPEIHWHLRVAPGLDPDRLETMAGSGITLCTDLPPADLAVVKSGTSSFEMAAFGIPEVICYRTSTLNYLLARLFVRVDNIGMPNIILGRSAVPELIQKAFTGESLARECLNLIENEQRYRRMQSDFKEMRGLLGNENPSQGVAAWIQSLIS